MSWRLMDKMFVGTGRKGGLQKERYGASQRSEAASKDEEKNRERNVGQSSVVDDDVKNYVIAQSWVVSVVERRKGRTEDGEGEGSQFANPPESRNTLKMGGSRAAGRAGERGNQASARYILQHLQQGQCRLHCAVQSSSTTPSLRKAFDCVA